MKQIIRIGGVPEHFNILWHYAIEHGYFDAAGLDVVWTDYPSGSSPMARDMDNQTIDMAVGITESFVTSIANGSQFKLVSWYVTSPLIWGIHTGAGSQIQTVNDMAGKKYAVSRLGSGSHLMALLDAENRGLSIHPDQFVIVNNLDGAVHALPAGEADLFFWEKFTTKPWVDNGTFRMIGEAPTPWPCFAVACGSAFLTEHSEAVRTVLEIIQRTAKEFRSLPNAVEMIAERYHQQIPDVQEWWNALVWAETMDITPQEVEAILTRLSGLHVVNTLPLYEDLVYSTDIWQND